MATLPARLGVAEILEQVARDVHDMAFDFLEPAASPMEAEARVDRVEDLAEQLKAAVRGTR